LSVGRLTAVASMRSLLYAAATEACRWIKEIERKTGFEACRAPSLAGGAPKGNTRREDLVRALTRTRRALVEPGAFPASSRRIP